MQRRDFLIRAAVVGGVAVMGLPDLSFGGPSEEIDEASAPNYTLFGSRRHGCALHRNYHHQADSFPDHVARLLA